MPSDEKLRRFAGWAALLTCAIALAVLTGLGSRFAALSTMSLGGEPMLRVTMEQGRLAACHAFGIACRSLPHLFPFGIYSVPEISMVGQNEEELTAAGVPYEVGVSRYREIARGAILGDDSGLLKILFHRDTRRILGVHIIGTNATELVHIGQAVLAHDGTIDYFVNAVFNYPTFAECYKVAALDGYNKVGPPR